MTALKTARRRTALVPAVAALGAALFLGGTHAGTHVGAQPAPTAPGRPTAAQTSAPGPGIVHWD